MCCVTERAKPSLSSENLVAASLGPGRVSLWATQLPLSQWACEGFQEGPLHPAFAGLRHPHPQTADSSAPVTRELPWESRLCWVSLHLTLTVSMET